SASELQAGRAIPPKDYGVYELSADRSNKATRIFKLQTRPEIVRLSQLVFSPTCDRCAYNAYEPDEKNAAVLVHDITTGQAERIYRVNTTETDCELFMEGWSRDGIY